MATFLVLSNRWIILSPFFIYKCNSCIIYCSSRNIWTCVNVFNISYAK